MTFNQSFEGDTMIHKTFWEKNLFPKNFPNTVIPTPYAAYIQSARIGFRKGTG